MVEDFSTSEEEENALKFFEKTLELIVKYLQKLPELIQPYLDGREKADLYYTDVNVALAESWPEILFTLARLFGGDLRTSAFFALPITDRQTVDSIDFKFAESPGEFLQYGICKLIEKFGSLNGFEQLLALINLGPDDYCPLEILSQIPVGTISSYLKDSFASEFIPKYRDAVLNRVNNVSSKELKGIDKSYYSRILNNLALLMSSMSSSESNYEMVETLELNLALKFIKCGLLEKRLRGIKEISDFIERVHVKSHPPKETVV